MFYKGFKGPVCRIWGNVGAEIEYNTANHISNGVQSAETKNCCVLFVSMIILLYLQPGSGSSSLTRFFVLHFYTFKQPVWEGEIRGVHLVAFYNPTAICQWLIHTGPLKEWNGELNRVKFPVEVKSRIVWLKFVAALCIIDTHKGPKLNIEHSCDTSSRELTNSLGTILYMQKLHKSTLN